MLKKSWAHRFLKYTGISKLNPPYAAGFIVDRLVHPNRERRRRAEAAASAAERTAWQKYGTTVSARYFSGYPMAMIFRARLFFETRTLPYDSANNHAVYVVTPIFPYFLVAR